MCVYACVCFPATPFFSTTLPSVGDPLRSSFLQARARRHGRRRSDTVVLHPAHYPTVLRGRQPALRGTARCTCRFSRAWPADLRELRAENFFSLWTQKRRSCRKRLRTRKVLCLPTQNFINSLQKSFSNYFSELQYFLENVNFGASSRIFKDAEVAINPAILYKNLQTSFSKTVTRSSETFTKKI